MSHPLAIMECMAQEADRTENYKNVTTTGACGGKPVRRVVHCDGIRGVLEQREGRWLVQNEQEVRVTAALGGSGRAFEQLRALAATLDAGLVGRANLTQFNTRLRAIADAENMSRVWVTDDLLPAVAFACSLLPTGNGSRWLAWALSARLDANLSMDYLPGPGWCSMTAYRQLRPWGHEREVRWLDAMPKSFWERFDSRRECCPPEDAGRCLGAGEEPCLMTVRIASDPRTQPGVLKELAQSSDEIVLDLVASHPRTPAQVLLSIAENRDCPLLVRLRVPQNRSVLPWLLSRLAKSPVWQVRGLAAVNSAMPVSVLKSLSTDESEFVRQVVALNTSTAEDELRSLADDDESKVRSCVASNSSCPVDLLERLLVDRIAKVRANAARHPAVPPERALALAGDRAMGVRAAVASRSDMPGHALRILAADEKVRVRRAAASNQATPADALESLAAAADRSVRYWVGGNPSAPETVLRVLAADPELSVRTSVAKNDSSPAELLEAASTDVDSCVREALAGNASTPADLLASLALDDCYWVRANVARNASAPPRALQALAADEHAEVRAEAARNPSIPGQLLEALAVDQDYRVRADAAENLKKRRESQQKGREES